MHPTRRCHIVVAGLLVAAVGCPADGPPPPESWSLYADGSPTSPDAGDTDEPDDARDRPEFPDPPDAREETGRDVPDPPDTGCRRDSQCPDGVCRDGECVCRNGDVRRTDRSCGFKDRGQLVERCRNHQWRDDCRGVWYASCLEIHRAKPNRPSGMYTIDPDGPDRSTFESMEVRCDMTTDGGGWTGIERCLARNDLNGTMEPGRPTIGRMRRAEVDSNCRPVTRDGPDQRHTFHYTFSFPASFDQFYLENYAAKANARGSVNPPDTSELGFKQQVWIRASSHCSSQSRHDGEISFGTPAQSGPVTSYSRVVSRSTDDPECTSCEIDWGANGRIFDIGRSVRRFRIGWGECGAQVEGWYPWWSGTIWVR